MLSALKRLAGRNDGSESAPTNPSHQTMSANLQRKFAKGVQYNMKIVIKGDRNVGKTCLFHRLQGKKFIESYIPTEEIQVASIHWNYKATDDIVKVEVWDVVDKGKKKKTFDGLKLDNSQVEIPQEAALDAEFLDVYKNTNGVILVMDITKTWTFNYIQNELPKIPTHIPIIILANHCDMSHHRTVTSHHLTFYVENLQRGPDAAEVRCCESSMRNGFGLKILHKFFNLPFLQLQRDTLLKQLETNRNETELTINELDLYMESDEADYNKFLENLVQKRRVIADASKPIDQKISQNIQHSWQPQQQQQQPVVKNCLVTSHSENEIKSSAFNNKSYKIGPIGGGHPISLGPKNKTIVESKSDVISQGTDKNVKEKPIPCKDDEGLISKFLGKSKEILREKNEIKPNLRMEIIATVDEFVPDDGIIDRSFLEDGGQDITVNAETESESAEEFGNPLVSGFQDDLDPDDLSSSKNLYNNNTILNNDNNNSNIIVNKNNTKFTIRECDKTKGIYNGSVNDICAQLNSVAVNEADSKSMTQIEVENIFRNNSQTCEITREALDTWMSCDSKWRRSPEGGEDSQKESRKIKNDTDSSDSVSLNETITSNNVSKKEKKHEKEGGGKTKKLKKKSLEKSKERSKNKINGDKKKKKVTKMEEKKTRERDELEEFLNGPITLDVDASYEAF